MTIDSNYWPEPIESILSVGADMGRSGIRNYALEKEPALSALDHLASLQVGVTGGDVFRRSGESFIPTYDSWYCNRESGEEDGAYVLRSVQIAKTYVAAYPSDNVQFVVVPLVFGDQPV